MNRDLPQLTAGTRYVYFSSLSKEESPLYQSLRDTAMDLLYDVQNDIKFDPNN